MPHRVVMMTTSYPRFPGDGIGSFIEPIAKGIAARGHEVHLVAPWHPRIERPAVDDGVHFHFFRYAPTSGLHVFGYAAALTADVALRPTACAVAPLAVVAGNRMLRRVARRIGASIIHAHWVIPGGVIAMLGTHQPMVVSLHGSDVFLAEASRWAGTAARRVFRRARWVTACSDDLGRRAVDLGANPDRLTVVPYGVDTTVFRPDLYARAALRHAQGIADTAPVVMAAGRLVEKKGFTFLIDAVGRLADAYPALTLVIAGDGDLEQTLRSQATRLGIDTRVVFLGALAQRDLARWLATADIVAVPSIRDDAGNVDGLPNVLLEALASGTPVIATHAGGMSTVAIDGRTARVVPQRDAGALATSIRALLDQPAVARQLGHAARDEMNRAYGWGRAAERFEQAYDRAASSA